MAKRFSPAKGVAKPQGGGFWIDHAEIVESDESWLQGATELTLWNVKVPPGFLGLLRNLIWLDIRGGSAQRLSVKEAGHLRYLAVNQVRGLSDLSELSSLPKLRYLNLYGLAKAEELPSLGHLLELERIDVGQMQSLRSLGSLLDAPRLKELHLSRCITVSGLDLSRIESHPTLQQFGWMAADVPIKVWEPVLNRVKLPRTTSMHPKEWFALRGGVNA